MHKLILENITKEIKGSTILNNISLELSSGNIYGFVGKNGSGKSMLFKTITGLIKPTSGKIIVDNKEVYRDISSIGNIGIVIENSGLYLDMTGFCNLKFLAKIKGVINDTDIRNTIKRVGLDDNDKRTLKKYSLGMKQKIVIAQALMEKPDFLFMDEPTNALDMESVDTLRKILLEEKERGAMILIASHNSEDIDVLCDKVYYMANGVINTQIV